MNQSNQIINMRVDAIDRQTATRAAIDWGKETKGHYICVANVHMCMESYDDSDFNKVVRSADLVVADGLPLVWALKCLGKRKASHVRGADLMLDILGAAQKFNLSIGFYGGTISSLNGLLLFIKKRFPELNISFSASPPFRPLTPHEEEVYISKIRKSGTNILFVGLGCPKQENWMYSNVTKLSCLMIGVGAAFDFYSGQKTQAPVWMQRTGLEWAFRLLSEPSRLWKRYFYHNPRFLWYFLIQLHRNRIYHS